MPEISSFTSSALVKMLFDATTAGAVGSVLAKAKSEGIGGERYLGDRDNNAGTVQIASSPYSALIERITNSFDGVIEMHAEMHPAEDMPTSPREAAARWLGMPIAGINDLTDTERRAMAENVRVLMHESGEKTHPSLSITDQGIGQHPSEFPNGLLSLNRSHKLKKRWLQGAYGQGGSATFRFSKYTVIIGRRKPELLADGQHDSVGWTVVWEDEGDPWVDTLPSYKYLVGPDNEVPTFAPDLLPDADWHGVRIMHVQYELPKYSQAFTQMSNGLWGMLHAALFDPVLPFIVGGDRASDLKVTKAKDTIPTRVVVGNSARLNSPKGPGGDDLEVAYSNTETFDLGKATGQEYGRFRVHYWVLRRGENSDSKTDPTKAYVSADSAVSMTLYGQRQDSERRAWLKNKVMRPYLTRNLIVQIDVDDLSPPAKRLLFSSTRERGVDGAMRDLIYSETAEILSADSDLKRLDQEERERLRRKSAAEVGQKVKNLLRNFVKSLAKDQRKVVAADQKGADTRDSTVKPTPQPRPPRDTDDSQLPNVPSALSFERDPITITQGKRTTVWVLADAKNGYLRRHEDDLRVTITGLDDKVTDVAKSDLLAGRSLWTLQAQDDTPLVGGTIEAELITPNGILTARADIRVLPPPKDRKKEKEEADTGPNIDWVREAEWDAHEFTERSVGRVEITEEHTDIWVNYDQRNLAKALRTRGLSPDEVKIREDRYLFAVGCGLYQREHQIMGSDDPGPEPDYVLGEQERLAESVLIAIDERMLELDDD